MMVFLLENYYFYASGHETIFTNIKWESAFHGFDGDNNSILLRILMGGLIVFNTFSSILISTFFLFWNFYKNQNSKSNLIAKFSFLTALKVFTFI